MPVKLQGDTLRAVVAEVLTEQEQAERAAAKAEVKRIVGVIRSDIKREEQNKEDHLTAAVAATKRMKALQERLKKIKAGDQGALKAPETVGMSPTGRHITPYEIGLRQMPDYRRIEERALHHFFRRAPYNW